MWELVSQQLLRALRGQRSQIAFSRRLGYRTNVAADWEVGRRFPTARRALAAAGRCGVDIDAAMEAFHPRAAGAWRADGLSAWLRALAGSSAHQDIAGRAGATRHQVGRWLRGDAEPRLPQLLALIEAMTGRVADWVSALVGEGRVPALDAHVAARTRVLRLAYEEPWSSAVYVALATLKPEEGPPAAAIARKLGLEQAHVAHLLEVMTRGGVLEATASGLQIARPMTVDVPPDGDAWRVRRHWAGVSAERLGHLGEQERFSFNVCAVSEKDLDRLLELQSAYFRELRSIVAASEPLEAVVLVTMHTGRMQ